MHKFTMAIECKCPVPMCEHSEHKMTEILQDAFDEGYDDGWDAAFALLNSVLRAKGITPPSEAPPAPKRGKRKVDLEN
jgi:hypothetical protein